MEKELKINTSLLFKILLICQAIFLIDNISTKIINLPILLLYLPSILLLIPIVIIGCYVYIRLIMGESVTMKFFKDETD